MYKATASQKWTIVAWNSQTGARVTGDASNITAKINIDEAGLNPTDDTNPTESESGHYAFDMLSAETDGDKLELIVVSSTANVECVGLPAVAYTRPQNFSELGIAADGDLHKVNALDGHAAQTGDSYARLGANGVGLTALPLNDPTAAEIRAEIDSNSTQLAAIVEDTGSTLPVSIVGMRAVVDAIYVDTGTTLDTKIDSVLEDTGTTLAADIAGVRGVVDAVLEDTGTTLHTGILNAITSIATTDLKVDSILEDTGTTIPAALEVVDDYVDAEVAAIKTVTDKLDDTLEDSAGTFRFTTASLVQSHSSPVISQVYVPDSRIWLLVRQSSGGLLSSGPALGMQVGEDLLFAADFRNELGRGDWLSTVSSVAIDTGTASGITFDSADQATNGTLAKFSIVAVTVGSYTVRVKVISNNGQTIEGDCSLKVIAA